MIKICGLTAIFIACVAAGLIKSNSLSKRVRELEAFLSAFSQISTEIRYFASPTNIIISKLDSFSEYKNLRIFGPCKENLAQTHDFSHAWCCAIDQAIPYLSLKKSDIETIKGFGSTFGTTDAEGQIANCERYCELLRQRLENAREDKIKRGRMYTSLGVLAGVFFVVFFY